MTFCEKMKYAIPALLLGIVLGVGGAMLALPSLEKSRELRIVEGAIDAFSLPALPTESRITYAYHNDQFVLEWYGFEIQTTPEQAAKWKTETDRLNSKKIDCKLRNSHCIVVRLFESHK